MRKSTSSFFGLMGGNPLQGLKPLMDFWSDGTIESGQLLDKSGNERHATVTSNLVSNPGAELGGSLDDFQPATPATTKASSAVDAQTGTRCYDVTLVSVPVSSGVKTKPFILVAGETVNWSFWIKRINATTLFYQLNPDDGGAAFVASTSMTPTLNTWVQISGSFVAPRSSGRCYIAIQGLAGTHAFRLDNFSVTITGQTNNAFVMPDVADLKTADAYNEFYTSDGVARTTRADYQYNANTNRIYCGGAFSYILLKADPSYSTHNILAANFQNLDHAFDSCPITLEVGSGKTYANIRTAELVAHNGDFRHRRRLKVFDDEGTSLYTDFQYTGSAGGYKAYIQSSKIHTYIDGVGTRTITSTKEVSCTDSQLRLTECVMFTVPGGIRNININKSNGGYFMHQDFPGMENGQVIIKDCEFIDSGLVGVLEYRIANALPAPALEMTWSVIAGGGHPKFRHILQNVYLESIFPLSWQNVACDTDGFDGFYDNVEMVAVDLYDPVSNPTQTSARAIRLFSSNVQECYLYFKGSSRNTEILKTGTPETLITTGI